jgi:hypothetical protein
LAGSSLSSQNNFLNFSLLISISSFAFPKPSPKITVLVTVPFPVVVFWAALSSSVCANLEVPQVPYCEN